MKDKVVGFPMERLIFLIGFCTDSKYEKGQESRNTEGF